jgi:hypothetical protein
MPPEQGEMVELRAFRGSRRASVYRAHAVPEVDFARILESGAGHDLALLSSLGRRGSRRLDKDIALQLAAETSAIRMSGELPDLDGDLVAIAELARWCARAPARSWMTIESLQPA